MAGIYTSTGGGALAAVGGALVVWGIVKMTSAQQNALESAKDGKWVNGKIYDFDSGNYYDVNLEIKDGVLYMRAYKGKPIFGKTIKWNLVQ